MAETILVIDAGTTSTRAMLFAPGGERLASAQRPLAQSWPQPGWVEHDPEEIWRSSLACAREVAEAAGGAHRIAALGITNQRETIIFWSRRTGRAFGPAIVWQDRRTAGMCQEMREAGHEPLVRACTGLLLDPYFSASKIAWALAERPELGEAGDDLLVGTVESWLVFNLTGGLHVSDATNASRTALMDIHRGCWDDDLLVVWGIPRSVLPAIVDCAGAIGRCDPAHLGAAIPIAGMAGDQQAAAIGQACLAPGDAKATYGTGAFILSNSGDAPRIGDLRLLATIAWQLEGKRSYALEGSLFVAGSLIQWLRDSLGLLAHAADSETMAREVESSAGVRIVPAFAGLGAPHWRPDARGAISGLGLDTKPAHIVRAALEAMGDQTKELMQAFGADGAPWESLRIDGGMAANDWMAQDLADALGIAVERPDMVETTALGAAMLTAVGCSIYPDLQAASAMRGPARAFSPRTSTADRAARHAGWQRAVAALLA